jgi:HK97 family phage major capsid protein
MTKHVMKSALLASAALITKGDDDDPAAAVTAALDEFKASFDDRLKAVESRGIDPKFVERLDRVEAKTNRLGTGDQERKEPSEERKAFVSYLRQGAGMPEEERKALTVANDTSGGYLAPSEFQAEVDKNIVEISPVRQAARVSSTSAGEVILPKRTGAPTGHWVGETEDRQETGSTYGQTEVPIHEMACYVDVSLKLLEDSAINVEAEVAFDVAEEFGRMEGGVFINGNGSKKPLGFVNAGLAYTPTGGATLGANPGDLLITHLYSMKSAYRGRGSWMMNGSTLAAIRKLKINLSENELQYLWQPSYAAGQPETLLGRPIIEAPDMDDIGADKFPIAFGDFMAGYRIFDRVGMSIFADPYTQRTQGKVRFHARRRVGGAVRRAEAIKLIKCAAA